MAKLTILLATFTVLLFIVEASIYRTTVIIDEETNPSVSQQQQQSCQKQFQQEQNLQHCQQFLREEARSQGSRGRRGRDDSQLEQRDMCCGQLQRMDTQCRCDNLERAIKQQQQKGELQGQEVSKAFQTAERLPGDCKLKPQQCQFGSEYWY